MSICVPTHASILRDLRQSEQALLLQRAGAALSQLETVAMETADGTWCLFRSEAPMPCHRRRWWCWWRLITGTELLAKLSWDKSLAAPQNPKSPACHSGISPSFSSLIPSVNINVCLFKLSIRSCLN